MKLKKALFGTTLLATASVIALNVASVDETARYSPRHQNIDQSYYNNQHGFAGAMEYYNERRKNIKTGKIEVADMIKAEKAVSNFGKASKQSTIGLNWVEMGPDNVGGRTRALMVDKNNSSRLWAGGVGGGLHVSYTSGLSWSPINDQMNSLAIGCICQSKDGDVYVGTGESFVGTDGQGTNYTPGFLGRGMYKSTDGLIFDSLPSTIPTNTNSNGAAWAFINRCATDPFNNELIYAATNNGLHYSTNGGTSWTNAICLNCPSSSPIYNTGNFSDVKMGSNGVIVAANGGTTYLKKPGATEFVNISNKFTGGNRFEFAIAPSNPDYIYVVAGSGGVMAGLWQSTDGGDNWTLQVPSGPAGVFNGQASYNMAIAVFPDDPEHIMVGGVELWAWSGTNNTWDLVALTQQFAQGLYVHADKHAFAFPANYNGTTNKTFYIGCDGGVYGSFDAGASYMELNSGYNVTQFYAMGVSREGWVAGGTQDNGNPFIDFTGNTPLSEVRNLPSGDGGYMQFSIIDPDAFFWESQGGAANRSPEKGSGSSSFFASIMCNGPCEVGTNHGAWVTPMVIWENFNDLTSTDSVRFIADQAYNAGASIFIESANADYPFSYVTPKPLSVNDTVMVQDIVQSKFMVSTFAGTWMCKNVLDFSTDPGWYKISNTSGGTSATFSADGDIVYLGAGNQLHRIDGLLSIGPNDANTSTTANPAIPAGVSSTLLYSSAQFMTGVGVDPNNSENVVITLGNYGNTNHVYVSSTAASVGNSGSFSSIQGNLPAMPCYDAIIEMTDSNTIIVGTEYGVWSTSNAWDTPSSVTWSDENNGSFPRVPSFMVVQQTMPNNKCTGVSVSGNVYVATHGRGIWRSEHYALPQDTEECLIPIGLEEGSSIEFDMDLGLYPNPVTNGNAVVTFTLNDKADVKVSLYNITGTQLRTIPLSNQAAGMHTMDLDCSTLKAGTYFVSITANGIRRTTRLLVL